MWLLGTWRREYCPFLAVVTHGLGIIRLASYSQYGFADPFQTFVQMSPFAANLSPANFSQPDSFIPERWLNEDFRFVLDDKSVLQPFSIGPRNCIGQK